MSSTDQPSAGDVPYAVVLSCDTQLAEHLSALHPAVRTAMLSRLAGIGTLSDGGDALLLLASTAGPLETTRTVARTIYVGCDLDDADVYARAAKLHADEVLHSPADDEQIRQLITTHVQACTGAQPALVSTVIPAPRRGAA